MSVDFALLKRPAGKAPKIKALPDGNYPGIIKSYETGLKSQNGTELVRFNLGLTDWADTVADDDKSVTNGSGQKEMIDLSKRQLRRDFYLTENALYRLDAFLRSLDIDLNGRDYESVLADTVGSSVMVAVGHYTNQKTGELGNQVEEITGQQ